MKNPMIFIVVKDALIANMLKYELQAQRFTDIHLLPSAGECFYALSKGRIPDFIVSDLQGNAENGISFLQSIFRLNARTRVLFLLSAGEEFEASHVMEAGATDFVMRSSHSNLWMKELIRNICYLRKQALAS